MEEKKQQILDIIQRLGLPMPIAEAKKNLEGLNEAELDEVLLNYQAAAGLTDGIMVASEPMVVGEEDLEEKLRDSERRELEQEEIDNKRDEEERNIIVEMKKIEDESAEEFQKVEDDYRQAQEELVEAVKKVAGEE